MVYFLASVIADTPWEFKQPAGEIFGFPLREFLSILAEMKPTVPFFLWHFLVATTLSYLAALHGAAATKPETLFVATPLTDEGAFTEGIEGPACDAQGNI